MAGVDVGSLSLEELIDVLMELSVQDSLHEKEVAEFMRKMRADILSRMDGSGAYDDIEQQYGMSNDGLGRAASPGEPLPYIPATPQTPDGYAGLDPPIGG